MKIFSIIIIVAFLLIMPAVYAQVQYPVQELDNCASQQDCEKYCDNIQNSESCLNFAEKAGMITKEEAAEARRMLPYLKAGETPGKCNSQKTCDEYCNKDENLQECIAFAEKAGLISGEELAIIKKTGGKGPGNCKGKEECDAFCNDESHFSECVDFAVANGMMDAKDAEIVKKTGGKGPGNCKGKEECDAYCNIEANFPTCVDFAVANGMMDAKDAEMAKKTGGKGPGGCKSKESCDAFCKNKENRKTCENFAIEHGLLSDEELANINKQKEFESSQEGQCLIQCHNEMGIDWEDCNEGSTLEACKTCNDKCFSHNNEKCLSQEKWQQLDADCKAKGSGYHLEEVKGDDGYGNECVTDETCVYSSDKMWESQEEKDRQLADMQKQWDEERARYEAEHGPGGSSNEGGSGGGGCTQPGPEGQCNPGPGAGPEPGNGDSGTTSGEGSGGSSEGSSGSDGGGSDSSESSSNSDSGSVSESSGGDAGITGEVINSDNQGVFSKLYHWIFG